jgi:hypothetical protein
VSVRELTREELELKLDEAEDGEELARIGEIRYRLRTVCSHCGKEGAEDHFDREGIFAGRWHRRCMTAADRHLTEYQWRPGDEPLEED